MAESRRTKGRAGATTLVVLVTLLGAAAPTAGQLYKQVYPGRDTVVVEPGKSIEGALTKASLDTRFDVEPLTEDEPAHFTATIVYGGKNLPNRPVIDVAFANDARLKPAKGKFEITPVTDTRQYLDQGSKRRGGGFQLAWEWEVVPRQSGSLALLLTIEPVVILRGSSRQDLAQRNKPIRINVKVHPNVQALAEVSSAAQQLQVGVPERLVVGEQASVDASLPLKGHQDTVKAEIALDRDEGSVPATIQQAESAQGGDELVRRWLVTPAAEGPVDLRFTVKLSTEAGDQPLQDEVVVQRSVNAELAPPSFWDRIQAPVTWLGPFVALAGGLLGLWVALRKRRPHAGTGAEAADDDADG
jgi:hypothetical protein